jgi:hypothetical protein
MVVVLTHLIVGQLLVPKEVGNKRAERIDDGATEKAMNDFRLNKNL